MARIASGNYDAVIVSHRRSNSCRSRTNCSTASLTASSISWKNAIHEASAETGDNRRIVKELEKAKKRLATKLKQRADREHKTPQCGSAATSVIHSRAFSSCSTLSVRFLFHKQDHNRSTPCKSLSRNTKTRFKDR